MKKKVRKKVPFLMKFFEIFFVPEKICDFHFYDRIKEQIEISEIVNFKKISKKIFVIFWPKKNEKSRPRFHENTQK